MIPPELLAKAGDPPQRDFRASAGLAFYTLVFASQSINAKGSNGQRSIEGQTGRFPFWNRVERERTVLERVKIQTGSTNANSAAAKNLCPS